MNTNEMNDGKIFILDFTFNRKLRILQSEDQVIQLRKKEADVLALLCDKYPNPVSQNDFLMKVWGGGYVTSQSIAQVIRKLRISLGDVKKSTISTIPKLGYKLTISPLYEDALSTRFQYGDVIKVNPEQDDFSFTEQQKVINVIPSTATISIAPYTQIRKKSLSPRKLIVSSIILIFGSLVCVTLSARSIIIDNVERHDKNEIKESSLLVGTQKTASHHSDEYLTSCNMIANDFISLLENENINNCFLD